MPIKACPALKCHQTLGGKKQKIKVKVLKNSLTPVEPQAFVPFKNALLNPFNQQLGHLSHQQ